MKAGLSLQLLTLQITLAAALPRASPQAPPADAIVFTTRNLVYESDHTSATSAAFSASVCTSHRTIVVTGTLTVYQTISDSTTSSVATSSTSDLSSSIVASVSSAIAASSTSILSSSIVAPVSSAVATSSTSVLSSSIVAPVPSSIVTPSTSLLSSSTVAPITSSSSVLSVVVPFTTNNDASGFSSITAVATSTPSPTTESVTETSLKTTLTTSEVQTISSAPSSVPTDVGTTFTSLNTTNHVSSQPIITSVIPTPSTTLAPLSSSDSNFISATTTIMCTATPVADVFVQIGNGGSIPAQIPSRGFHPVPRQGILNQTQPIETNKFYANFFLGSQLNPTWTHPYSVAWSKGGGPMGGYQVVTWGLSVSHYEASDFAFGQTPNYTQNTFPDTKAEEYFVTTARIQHMTLSASELGSSTNLTMDNLLGFSANVNLAVAPGAVPAITFPLVQGMGFVTAVYTNSTPLIQTGKAFDGVAGLLYAGHVGDNTTTVRYNVTLNDGHQWLIYLTPASGFTVPVLTAVNSSTLIADQPFTGSVQIAKNPNAAPSSLAIYDASAGAYPISGSVSGSTSGSSGSYTLSWTKGGITSRPLLMFALPHHTESIQASQYVSSITNSASRRRRQSLGTQLTTLTMQTTTKGIATAVVGDSWTLIEAALPQCMDFAPWSPTLGSVGVISASARDLLNQVAAVELAEDMDAQTNLNSMYYAGKGLAKFAGMIWTVNELGNNTPLASAGLVQLKGNFSRFINNTQIIPLVYDPAWGGVISSTLDSGADFGNAWYNDHHFHYGYFVYAAAVIAFLDPSWLDEGTNKAWVDMLLRDYANPSTTDAYFPFSRSFDWYHGHSWAHGLFESGDGKDQESSSEDTFSLYAMKMWGKVTGDSAMEARGNLQLAIQARSLQNYYLMTNDNTVQPAKIVPNKALGIMFEGKVDHTTYFGLTNDLIEAIHMIPISPASTLTRTKTFVQEEWATYFDGGRVNNTAPGWNSILYANLAIIDPVTSYDFFAQPDFDMANLDGGASRTWYLAFSAAMGGSS